MPNINIVVLAGHLVADPELKQVGSGSSLCTFTIAENEKYKDRNGEQQEEKAFVDCETWGGTAEFVSRYFVKGKAILVEGKLKTDQWTDNEGRKRSRLKMKVRNVQFADGGKTTTVAPGNQGAPKQAAQSSDPF